MQIKLDLDDADNQFFKDVAEELKALAEIFADRPMAEDARRAQDFSSITSLFSIFYSAGIVTIYKLAGPGLEFSKTKVSSNKIGFIICLVALFFTLRYYLYLNNDRAISKVRLLVAGLRLNILNNTLPDRFFHEQDEKDRKRAGAAHATLASLVTHVKWGRRGRWAVDLIFPASLWAVSAWATAGTPVFSN